MTIDAITPVEQAQAPLQPEVTPPAPPAPPEPSTPIVPDGYVDQTRFTGAMQKIEALTVANRELTDKLALSVSEVERMTVLLAEKDIEKTVAVGERDKRLETLVTEGTTTNLELEQLRAYKRKVEMAKTLGKPELIQMLDIIPDTQDEEVLKTVMTDIVGFADHQVQAREAQLLSGITPPVSPVDNTTVAPSTTEGWERHVNSLEPGSKEHKIASDQWGDWVMANPEK